MQSITNLQVLDDAIKCIVFHDEPMAYGLTGAILEKYLGHW